MLPDTLLGVVLFVAAAGPGYFFVRLTKVRAPREERTTLEEAAELATVGAIASALGVLLAFVVGKELDLLDPTAFVADPSAYAANHPGDVLVSLGMALAISYGVVWCAATRFGCRGKPTISPGESAWYAAFKRFVPRDGGVYLNVALKDGRTVSGIVASYTIETDGVREVVLMKPTDRPIYVRTSDGVVKPIVDTFIILSREDIFAISGEYLTRGPAQSQQTGMVKWVRTLLSV